MAERDHDIVLFGATGFTGGLTADYLAKNAPEGIRWAIAGRNRSKLEAVRERVGKPDLPLLHADAGDPGSLREVAQSTRVVATTVGPYIHFGEPIAAACAEAGTDYADITGEPEFVDTVYARHHERAAETGARLVHCCGFDSIPHDLGAYFTVKQLPEGVPIAVDAYVRVGGKPSGGTYQTAITGISRARETARAAKARRAMERRPEGRSVRGSKRPPHRRSEMGAWALPMPTIDPQIVLRSARALERYGPDFSYGHFLAVKRLPVALGLVGGVAGVAVAAQVPPARKWLLGRMEAGEGPSPARREKGWFKVRFFGEGGGKRVVCEVSGGDPGYSETSKMLSEAALCLASDDLPQTSGQVTTAQAMGDRLIERLEAAGMGFAVIEAT
ncbi:MAG TPA: saccharopine dehydrogenase NADP-binding domain-containing protein [Thermoleophilaceae bacterium]|nr:saccharopine dehydrogenase NADP-binding domain-containing protein [Thermoleophilaceae bacterium]